MSLASDWAQKIAIASAEAEARKAQCPPTLDMGHVTAYVTGEGALCIENTAPTASAVFTPDEAAELAGWILKTFT